MSQQSRLQKLEAVEAQQGRSITIMGGSLAEVARLQAEHEAQGHKTLALCFRGLDFSKIPPMPGKPDPNLVIGYEVDELDFPKPYIIEKGSDSE